jgi:hypothetical protein
MKLLNVVSILIFCTLIILQKAQSQNNLLNVLTNATSTIAKLPKKHINNKSYNMFRIIQSIIRTKFRF